MTSSRSNGSTSVSNDDNNRKVGKMRKNFFYVVVLSSTSFCLISIWFGFVITTTRPETTNILCVRVWLFKKKYEPKEETSQERLQSDPPGPMYRCSVYCFSLATLFCFPDGRTPCVNIMTTYWQGPGGSITRAYSIMFLYF